MIDYRDQRGTAERPWLEEYRDLADEKVVTIMDKKGFLYEAVRQSRTICVRSEYVLDVFQVVSDAPHKIDWIVHTIGKLEKSSIELEPADVNIPGPGVWLKDFRAGKGDDRIRLEWAEDLVRFAMTVAAEAGTKVITCGYPQSDEKNSQTIPMVFVERKAASTIYAVVYQAAKGKIPQADITALGEANGRLVYQVSGPWGNRRHLVPRLE